MSEKWHQGPRQGGNSGVSGVTVSVLQRKIGRGRDAADAPGPLMPERVLKLALGRAAQDDCGLALIVTRMEATGASLAEVLDRLEPSTLLMVLEGPDEVLGLVALGHPVLSGVIEQQTCGRLTEQEPPPRRPTRIDAALCAPMVDRLLGQFEEGLAQTPGAEWVAGYRYASFIEDPRPLGLVLEDCRYRLFLAHVALGQVARPGRVLLALPDRPAAPSPARPSASAAHLAGAGSAPGKVAEPQAEWQQRLHAAVMAAPAHMEAVLTRLRLPLAGLSEWAPGTLIPLPLARLDGLTLEAPRGKVLATARLGQSRGLRALRLSLQPGTGDEGRATSDQAPAAAPAALASDSAGFRAAG